MRAVLRETKRKLIGGCFSCRVTQEGELRTGEGGETRERRAALCITAKTLRIRYFLKTYAVHRRNAAGSRLSVCLPGCTDPWGFHWKNEEVEPVDGGRYGEAAPLRCSGETSRCKT